MTDKSSDYIFERANLWSHQNPILKVSGLHQTVREKKAENTPSYEKVQEIHSYYFPLHDLPNETSKYDMKNTRLLMKDLNGNLLYKM